MPTTTPPRRTKPGGPRRRPDSAPSPTACRDLPPDSADAPTPDDETLAAMAKALAHPARVRMLRILDARQACITGDMVIELELAQSTVSEHLRILREAGLIQGEIEGPRTRYCVNADGLAALKAGIATL